MPHGGRRRTVKPHVTPRRNRRERSLGPPRGAEVPCGILRPSSASGMEVQAGSRHLEIVLLHELSAGTFARLYLAEARAPGGLDRIVAVKILREQWNESAEVINRTRDEARLLARLRHRNILRVEDLSQIDGQLAIIMEFVDGLDLKQLVEALAARRLRVPPRAALEICTATAAALDAAYFKVPYGLEAPLQVVHRDIKPSNVMVTGEGETKVLDFGTARSSQAFRSVQTGALRFGSLKYMSPERREGDRGEHVADVYSLGLMLVEILRGEWLPLLPLEPTEHDEAVANAVNGLDGLGMPNREWDVALRQILLQMLAADPALRPNAEQVARLLRAFADQAAGESLEAFSREHVAPLTRQVRGNLTGGALAGTRFVVNFFDGTSGGKVTASQPKPPPPAPPPVPAARPEPQDPLTDPRGLPPPKPAPKGGVERSPATPSPSITAKSEPAPPPPAAPAQRSVFDEPEPSSGPSGLLLAGAGAGLLFFLGCAGLLTAGGGWYWWSGRQAASPVVVAAPSAAGSPAATAGAGLGAVGSEPVVITTEGGTVQWVRVQAEDGRRVLDGAERVEGSVAADTYLVTMKMVGRPVLKGSLTVPSGGASLACALQKEGHVNCRGTEPPLVLKP